MAKTKNPEKSFSDCRCSKDYNGIVPEWLALCSTEYWGEEVLMPNGLADGDTGRYEFEFVPIEEAGPCDMHGRLMNEADVFSGKFYNRIYTAVERRDAENLRILLERGADYLIESAEELSENAQEFLRLGRDKGYSQSFTDDIIDEYVNYVENDEEVPLSKKRKNSPCFSRAGADSKPNNSQLTMSEIRWNRRSGKKNGDAYKKTRKGGGRLSRSESRKMAKNIFSDFTVDIDCCPRVAIVIGIPERFFKTKRRQR